MQLYRTWCPVQDRHPQQDSPELYFFLGYAKIPNIQLRHGEALYVITIQNPDHIQQGVA